MPWKRKLSMCGSCDPKYISPEKTAVLVLQDGGFSFWRANSLRERNMKNAATLAGRRSGENPGHHLWNNHGTWWVHFTVHRADYTKGRVRRSLGTRSLEEAREIRDFLFATVGERAPQLF